MRALAQDGTQSGGTGGAAPDRIYADLRERIIGFELPPGATLGRSDLAACYGVSQTPVREALQRLEQDGLVRIFPQSRTQVAPIDVRQLNETQFLRLAVESEVVRRLAVSPERDAVLARAGNILQMQRVLADAGSDAGGDTGGDTGGDGGGDMGMFSELDRSFHLILFRAVGMAALHSMLVARLGHLYRCQRLELPMEGKMQSIVADHQDILDTLATGRPELAAAAMQRHFSRTINRIGKLRDLHPQYFSDGQIG